MNEKTFQDMVINLFKAKDAHAVNVEPGLTNHGSPDVNWCLDGIEGNLELKICAENGPAAPIRPAQVVWFRERMKAGGYPMFAYYVTSETYADDVLLFQGRRLAELVQCKTTDDIYNVQHLRVVNPTELVEAMMSEIASWHDELYPETTPLH